MLKLEQDQVWKQGDAFIRITHLERMKVDYKAMTSLSARDGKIQHASKKEFCRLIKGATLLTPAEAQGQ